MRIAPLVGLALRRLRQRPIRSLLLLQGTVWGVAVAVFPSAVLEGTRRAALRDATEIGADRVSLASDPTSATPTALTDADVTAVVEAVRAAAIPLHASGGVRVVREWGEGLRDRRISAAMPALLAATSDAPAARGHVLAAGRWLRDDDPPEACLVEAGVAAWLGVAPLRPGDDVRLPGAATVLRVAGVLAPRSARALRTDDLGCDLEHPMYRRLTQGFLMLMGIPFVRDGWKRSDRCVWTPLRSGEPVDWIVLRSPPGQVSEASAAARSALARRGRAVLALQPLVLPVVLSKRVERFGAVNLALFLACLAMGAVVMANLGLLSVLTRGREIAIRRVEGATRGAIAGQLLVEGAVLSAAGAGLGLVVALGLAELRVRLEPASGFTWTFPVREALWASAVALVVGLLSMLLPALRAARQNPVEGLVDD